MAKTQLTTFTKDDCKILDRRVLYNGFFKLAKYRFKIKLFEGGVSETTYREVLERNSAIGVLPYDPIQDKVLLIEQFRIGAINSNVTSPWLIEVIAGVYAEGENLEDAVLREAKEEANCTLTELMPIYDYLSSPGGCNEVMSLYVGRFDAPQTGGVYGLQEEGENIRSLILSTQEALDYLHQGKIKTSPAIVALQWLELNREYLKHLWQLNPLK